MRLRAKSSVMMIDAVCGRIINMRPVIRPGLRCAALESTCRRNVPPDRKIERVLPFTRVERRPHPGRAVMAANLAFLGRVMNGRLINIDGASTSVFRRVGNGTSSLELRHPPFDGLLGLIGARSIWHDGLVTGSPAQAAMSGSDQKRSSECFFAFEVGTTLTAKPPHYLDNFSEMTNTISGSRMGAP